MNFFAQQHKRVFMAAYRGREDYFHFADVPNIGELCSLLTKEILTFSIGIDAQRDLRNEVVSPTNGYAVNQPYDSRHSS